METLASETIGDVDRISHLPESIIHTILDSFDTSHGPPIDLVRMSVLSRTWLNLTASFPILYFIIDDFISRESFFKYVEYSTSRFCLQNVPAQKLTLLATISNPAEINTIYQCLELVLKKGVKELLVDITLPEYSSSPFPLPKYGLPDILLSVSVLKYLIIRHTALPSSLMVDGIKFTSLICLILCDVPVDDEMMKYLVNSCPFLQDLRISCCDGFQSLCVYGHQYLQHVSFDYETPLERIDIDAPNLSYLWVQDLEDRGPPRMNLASCRKLKTVTYCGRILPNDFLSNFPFIEYLHLMTDDTCNNLKLSSHSLRMETLTSEIIGDVDRISHLPESIVHTILDSFDVSNGPPIDLVRMSILSKTWFNLTTSFPILHFIIEDFISRESFFKYVEYTTSRFCLQNVPAQKLTLLATISNPAEINTIYQCLELILKKGVKELLVDITLPEYSSSPFPLPKYGLPDILLSVSVLKYLIIRHTALPSSLMVDGIKFKSLKCLILCDVPINDEMIRYLVNSCPLLQDLRISSCDGFQSLCVYGHQNLQHVSIDYETPLERIDIDAPNLSYLWVQDLEDRGPPRMNLASCKKLTTVTYCGRTLSNDFLSNFPFVEYLHLMTDDMCNNLKLSSRSLRVLVLELSSFPVTDSKDVIKFICDKLLQQEDQGRTSIQFVLRDEGKTIGFMKKDGIQQQAKEQSKVPKKNLLGRSR
ncbi:hypothetical protein SSX86_010043 [Deinandra increscens subsp. villosa]|uniref:F-box domain-containing protein n=1 Tax=Deinandra increscens subsp. villosa TaxID=3103831 RepID=A0AAP0H3L8_9ASTR